MSLYAAFKIRWKALALGFFTGSLLIAALLTLSAAAAGGEGLPLPVVMYHSLRKDPSAWGQYVIAPAQLEEDLTWLEDHGYTTVLVADLIAYTQGGELPEKPVLLTFDDGYFNNYTYAYPLALAHHARFVLSPIGAAADRDTASGDENPNYSQAGWPRLREMADSGLVEIQNHSYDLHRTSPVTGVKQRPGESDAAYRARLTADLEQAQQAILQGVGRLPTAFVYPFGAASPSTESIVRGLGFAATLTCEEKISRLTRSPEALYGLGRYNRPSGLTARQFFEERMGLS